MVSREKKEEFLSIILRINGCLGGHRLGIVGTRNGLLDLEDLVNNTQQIPADMKSVFIVRISEVRSELSLQTINKAVSAFDTLVIELFRYLHIRLPKKNSLSDRIYNYLYPEFYDH